MKKIIVEPFLSFKFSQELISNFEDQIDQKTPANKVINDSRKRINVKGANSYILVNPQTGEGFSFIPLIHKNRFFASKFPNPIQLYFELAFKSFLTSDNLKKNITLKDNDNYKISLIEEDLFNEFLGSKISSIIFLHSALEAFINHFIPENFIFTKEKNGAKQNLNKDRILKEVTIKDKFQMVFKEISGIDFKAHHKKIYDDILNLITTRNELIHLKIKKLENNLHYHGEVENIINLKIDGFIYSIQELFNLAKPGFLKIEDTDKQYFEFKFSTFKAFRLDISIFLEILKTSQKYIKLTIPFSDEKTFNHMKDWVMQNLEIMRSNNLLRITESNYTNKRELLICLEKTEKGYI